MESISAIWDIYDHFTGKALESGRAVNNRLAPFKEETISNVGQYKLVRVVDSKVRNIKDGIPRYAVLVRILVHEDSLEDVQR